MMRMSLESLPFTLLMIAAIVATFVFAAWALYAQTHGRGTDAGWAVEGSGTRAPRRRQLRS